jgi:hypothetical protein
LSVKPLRFFFHMYCWLSGANIRVFGFQSQKIGSQFLDGFLRVVRMVFSKVCRNVCYFRHYWWLKFIKMVFLYFGRHSQDLIAHRFLEP